MSRRTRHQYRDPVEVIWLEAAARLGIRVTRSDQVYAAWDGRGTLTLGGDETLDPDDSLAQMIFHELCHALVAGEVARGEIDWDFTPEEIGSQREALREHATHRLQAALADEHGLRVFLAVTTDWRGYYDDLPADPLSPVTDLAAVLARRAFWCVAERHNPWLCRALPLHYAYHAQLPRASHGLHT